MNTLEEVEREIEALEQRLIELKKERLKFGICKINDCGLPCQGTKCKEYLKK